MHHTGVDSLEKKFGQGKVDPAKMRSTNEKVTDQATGMFEKATGYVEFSCLSGRSVSSF